MKRLSRVERLVGFILLAGILGGLSGTQIALANQKEVAPAPQIVANDDEAAAEEEAAPIEEKIELSSRFPVKQGESGSSYEFEVSMDYQGNETKIFYFDLDAPDGWQIQIQRQYSETAETVLAQTMEPNQTYPPAVTVIVSPLPGEAPLTGEYPFTFTATSGNLSDSIDLKAIVTEMPLEYDLGFTSQSERLDFIAKPGAGNSFAMRVTNLGSGQLTNISFTSVKSEGWGTTFSPSLTQALDPGESIDIEMVLTPPEKTIAGDYRVLIRAGADSPDMRLQEQLDLRVRVQTSTAWGAAGIIIVVAVIVGLALMFRNLGRR